MSLRLRMAALVALAALCGLPLNNHSALAADKDRPHQHGKLIQSIETMQQITVPKRDSASPNATLPAPGGGSITWNVSSRLDLYENMYGGRSARCFVSASTSQPVYGLWVSEAVFYVDGKRVHSAQNYNRHQWNPTNYEWTTTNHYGQDGPSEFRCVGTNHSAQVTSGGVIYGTSTLATTIW